MAFVSDGLVWFVCCSLTCDQQKNAMGRQSICFFLCAVKQKRKVSPEICGHAGNRKDDNAIPRCRQLPTFWRNSCSCSNASCEVLGTSAPKATPANCAGSPTFTKANNPVACSTCTKLRKKQVWVASKPTRRTRFAECWKLPAIVSNSMSVLHFHKATCVPALPIA